jgi:hypothetical protein
MTEWLTVLRLILEVSGSNFVPETGYLDRISVVFPGPSMQMPGLIYMG